MQYYDVKPGARLGLYDCNANAPAGEPPVYEWESFSVHPNSTILTPAGLCVTAPGAPSGPYAGVVDLKEHLASFLLMRGPYAWIGFAWVGCSQPYVR